VVVEGQRPMPALPKEAGQGIGVVGLAGAIGTFEDDNAGHR
jgi:hypothetical protein